MNITCGSCGNTFDSTRWVETVMGPLPGGDFQCPHCKVAIRRKALGTKIIGSGDTARLVPDRIVIERIQPRL